MTPSKNTLVLWAAFRRATFDPSEADAPDIFVGLYSTREEALDHCWPKGDGRLVSEERFCA